jgi:2-phosphosulfolactate phosphatase
VAIVAAGERWGDDSLRAAWEDVWGAGAVIAGIGRQDLLSPEALAAADAFRSALLRGLPLGELASGWELIGQGFAQDVAVAAELDTSLVVPVLRNGVFTRATSE